MEAFLKKIPLFAGIPEDDFARLCELVEEVKLPAGEQLFAEGTPGKSAYVIVDGELEIIKTSGRREVLLSVRGSGDVIGEMSLLEGAPRIATVRAYTDVTLLAIHQDEFDRLMDSCPSVTRALLHTVLGRWRNTESQLRQSEKLAQLGTLSAGIAHELNNPAAAVRRGSAHLQEAITRLGEAQAQLPALQLSPEQQERLAALLVEVPGGPGAVRLNALARSDLEDKLESWLEGRNVPDAWEYTATLVDMGLDVNKLESVLGDFPPAALPTVAGVLTANYAVRDLLHEVGEGASRISEIVRALKSYAYLDQAPVQAVDLHAALENTLIILRSRLKGIEVERDYAPDLPPIQAYGSELNQVFTNILDNAADALEGQGRIIIRTRAERDAAVVEIEDNGPGIPEEVQTRIFDPFFTTKPPGQGTGLGLNTSYNIVVHKHRGNLEVFSSPGRTCFRITIPLDSQEMALPRSSEQRS